jgi:hypothetical protein
MSTNKAVMLRVMLLLLTDVSPFSLVIVAHVSIKARDASMSIHFGDRRIADDSNRPLKLTKNPRHLKLLAGQRTSSAGRAVQSRCRCCLRSKERRAGAPDA